MQKAIVGVLPRSGADFDALTGLYRMIFAYVMNHFGKLFIHDLMPPRPLYKWDLFS